ncbi:MAG: metal-sensing transcriptional repressor [Cyanobacteria bacterium J06555_12]
MPVPADRSQFPTHSKAHPHIHDPEAQRKLMNRLSRIEGHVRGIRSMIQQQQPCPDVLLQIAAVRGALDRVARLVLDDHITECIAHAAESGDIKVELDELRRALDRFIR